MLLFYIKNQFSCCDIGFYSRCWYRHLISRFSCFPPNKLRIFFSPTKQCLGNVVVIVCVLCIEPHAEHKLQRYESYLELFPICNFNQFTCWSIENVELTMLCCIYRFPILYAILPNAAVRGGPLRIQNPSARFTDSLLGQYVFDRRNSAIAVSGAGNMRPHLVQ